MSQRFLRLDVSPKARDFEHVAIEPGLPLLDRNNANYAILRKWLGRLIAEPEWDGNYVNLYVTDGRGGRPHNVQCLTASAEDLRRSKSLQEDLQEIEQRLREAQPSAKEAKLHQAILRHFEKVQATSGHSQSECQFFKYNEGGEQRLVWGWGYQRKDLSPATPMICTNPNCSLLFVRRHDERASCPACESGTAGGAPPRKRSLAGMLMILAFVALLAAGAGYALRDRWLTPVVEHVPVAETGLFATPAHWSSPVGGQIDFKVVQRTESGEEDVTSRVVAVIEDPRIVRADNSGATIQARAQGKTAIHFLLGNQKTDVTVDIEPASNPKSLVLSPSEIVLGIGTTAQLQVMGEYGDDRKVDLTEVAEWESIEGNVASCLAGHLEGMHGGESTVKVRYRATPSEPYLTASAKITVFNEDYNSLKLKLSASSIAVGERSEFDVEVSTAAGETRSVRGSSKLKLKNQDPSLAKINGRYLVGIQEGAGTLTAEFGTFQAEQTFNVGPGGLDHFEVTPKDLILAVGETAEFQVISSSQDPIRLTSSDPNIVEVGIGTTIVGLRPGKTEVIVAQEAREHHCIVEVVAVDIQSIAFVPEQISVLVDGTAPVRLVGTDANGKSIDLASGIVWEQLPTSSFVELDVEKMQLLGRSATGEIPQRLSARFGDLRAQAQVEVVAPPRTVELTPTGPISLATGLSAKLQAWANYGNGKRVEISPERLEWKLDPESSEELQLNPDEATVSAVKEGSAVLGVVASYQGFDSNRVEIRQTNDSIKLAVRPDRNLFVTGDTGRFTTTREGLSIPFLVPDGIKLESSDPKLMVIDAETGAYRALAAGKVTVTATHPTAEPATLAVEIVDPVEVKLEFRPANLKLMVGCQQVLELYRITGEREEKISLIGDASNVRLSLGPPEAILWRPPVLVGIAPHAPFEIVAEHGNMAARMQVEVIAEAGDKLRVVPSQIDLAAGQTYAPRVELQLPGQSDQWQEVESARVKWKVPATVTWTPASDNLRPQLVLAKSAKGTLELTAEYAGKAAKLTIHVSEEPIRADGELHLVREPDVEEIPEGSSQRYSVVLLNGSSSTPAPNVVWMPAFENDHVKWEPPVLYGKRAGHVQNLSAKVDDEELPFSTRIVGPASSAPVVPPPPPSPPEKVLIVSPVSPPIQLPVKAEFEDFHVEAHYPGRLPVDVTSYATLSLDGTTGDAVPVALSDGKIHALRPGKVEVKAEYLGVKSSAGLNIEVVPEPEIASLEIHPANPNLKLNENLALHVQGFTQNAAGARQSAGDITALPGLVWNSSDKSVVEVVGGNIRALKPGKATISVNLDDKVASVEVVVTEAPGTLELSPRALRIKVGETKWFGKDVTLKRGTADFSDQLTAVSSAPLVLRYNPSNRSLEGLAPGRALLSIKCNGESLSLPVEVELDPVPNEGTIAIEPSTGSLSTGEVKMLKVFLVGKDGSREDRTNAAILSSSNTEILSVAGNRITGVAAGTGEISARLSGIEEPGTASFTVEEEPITELLVTPTQLKLGVGDRKSIQIFGIGPKGRRELSRHPNLKVVSGGQQPGCIEIQEGTLVRGVSVGKASIEVSWQGVQAKPVAVDVENIPITALRIQPPAATVEVSKSASFLVFGKRGNEEVPLTAEDGVKMQIANRSVAGAGRNLTAVGRAVGRTEVTVNYDNLRAEASLTVTPERPDNGLPISPLGLRFIPDILTIQMGVPGASVRVVKVLSNQEVEDVDHRADFVVQDPEIAEVKWTASGPVFIPKKLGTTNITASLGSLTTLSPLVLQVVDPKDDSRLRVQPDPIELAVDESKELSAVEIDLGDGDAPNPIDDWVITSGDENLLKIENGRILHGISPGETRITVHPQGVGPELADLQSTVSVTVKPKDPEPDPVRPEDPPTQNPPPNARLVLRGPSRTNVGAETKFSVEYVGGESKDVTADGAVLVVENEQARYVDLQPGCILIPKHPGKLKLRARYQDLVSNELPLQIDPVHSQFKKIELEIASHPMKVGEVRPYKFWGYPVQGPRQDLTAQVRPSSQELNGQPIPRVAYKVSEPAMNPNVVEHSPPTVVAKAPGRFQLVGVFGSDQRTNIVDIEILPGESSPTPGDSLRPDPASITIRSGERTPPIAVITGGSSGRPLRSLAADWSSEDDKILTPDPEKKGRFVGQAAGKTRLKGAFEGQEVYVDVTVTGDPFGRVTIHPTPKFRPQNHFAITVEVEPSVITEPVEYRIVMPVGDASGKWSPATDKKVLLDSPDLRGGPSDTTYHLRIEARNPEGKIIARYPLSFKVSTQTTVIEKTDSEGK